MLDQERLAANPDLRRAAVRSGHDFTIGDLNLDLLTKLVVLDEHTLQLEDGAGGSAIGVSLVDLIATRAVGLT